MAQLNPRSFTDAQQLGDAVYELILNNWGNRGMAQDANNGSISYPPVKSNANGSIPIIGQFTLPTIPSLSAIAIAPRSMVDRCIVNYAGLPQASATLTPGAAAIDSGFVNEGAILESEQVLDAATPLIGQQPGPVIIRAHPTSYFSDTFISDASATTAPFGTALTAAPGGGARWTNPELRLLLYLNGGPLLPPGQRAPLHIAVPNYAYSDPGLAEELLIVVPIMGREHVRVQYRAGGNNTDIRISGVQWNGVPAGGPAFVTNNNYEFPLVTSATVNGQTSQVFAVDHPGISFLLVNGKPSVALENGQFTVDAFD